MSTFGFQTWAEYCPRIWNVLPGIEIQFKSPKYISFSWLCFELTFINT